MESSVKNLELCIVKPKNIKIYYIPYTFSFDEKCESCEACVPVSSTYKVTCKTYVKKLFNFHHSFKFNDVHTEVIFRVITYAGKNLLQSASLSREMEDGNTRIRNPCQLTNVSKIKCIQNDSYAQELNYNSTRVLKNGIQ